MPTSDNSDRRQYNKPPRETQFKPGQSGNVRGRPKSTSIDVDEIVDAESAQTVTATGSKGRKIRLTKVEATAHQLVNAALRGDSKAIAVVLGLATKLKDSGALIEDTVVHVSWAKSAIDDPS